MTSDNCGICGGDGRISNSFGLTTRCPSCHGTGRRSEDTSIFHDVTKTKASHHTRPNTAPAAEKQTWPVTFEGGKLAGEVRDCTTCSSDTKAKLIREIIEYEGSHGRCTQTFTRKVRKRMHS